MTAIKRVEDEEAQQQRNILRVPATVFDVAPVAGN